MRAPNDDTEPRVGALWRDFRDGTGGPGVRVVLSFASGLLLGGIAHHPPTHTGRIREARRSGARSTIIIDDEMVSVALGVAGTLYLMVLVGIWSRYGRSKGFWLSGVKTVVTGFVAAVLSVGISEYFSRDDEVLILAIWLLAASVTLLFWAGSWRSHTRGRSLYAGDGRIDLRCPECGYRMVGLNEARCPECGQRYMLDDLLAKQGFAAAASRTTDCGALRPEA